MADIARSTSCRTVPAAGAPSAVKSIEPSLDCHGRMVSMASFSTGHAGCRTTRSAVAVAPGAPTGERISVMTTLRQEILLCRHGIQGVFDFSRAPEENVLPDPHGHALFSCPSEKMRKFLFGGTMPAAHPAARTRNRPPYTGRGVATMGAGRSAVVGKRPDPVEIRPPDGQPPRRPAVAPDRFRAPGDRGALLGPRRPHRRTGASAPGGRAHARVTTTRHRTPRTDRTAPPAERQPRHPNTRDRQRISGAPPALVPGVASPRSGHVAGLSDTVPAPSGAR
ncbi:hypothetical protein SRIMM317S_02660 [Streptomyces rimosus subsp. rimosus]